MSEHEALQLTTHYHSPLVHAVSHAPYFISLMDDEDRHHNNYINSAELVVVSGLGNAVRLMHWAAVLKDTLVVVPVFLCSGGATGPCVARFNCNGAPAKYICFSQLQGGESATGGSDLSCPPQENGQYGPAP